MKSKIKKWVLPLFFIGNKTLRLFCFLHFVFFLFCVFLFLFCFCNKVVENCGVLVHKLQRLLLENFSCYKKTLLYFACFQKLLFLLFF